MISILQRLAQFLDRPLFPWKRLILSFTIGQFVLESYLTLRQYQVLKRTKTPQVLQQEVTPEVYAKSQAYGRAKAKFSLVQSLYSQIINFIIIQGDLLPTFWHLAGRVVLRFFPVSFTGEITRSIVFILGFTILQSLINLPVSYYHHFVLEEAFGFNKQTMSLFVTDFLKTQLLSFVLVPPILSGFLKIVQSTGNQFFVYLWLFGAGIMVLGITIYPIFILPLFNKLSPLQDGTLKTSTETLAKKLKFPLHELFVIDGSKRSSHSNAYFFGLPWKKHIVIFDTLIEKSSPEEVVAVLAHELGHWSLGHTTKNFIVSQVHLFYVFAIFSAFVDNRSLFRSFGFYDNKPIIIAFLLFSDAFAPLDCLMRLALNIMSRRFEYQADEFARKLGYASELAQSLIKLQVQNLSTMEADWMYSAYHYSHPILSERLKAIGWAPQGKILDEKDDAKTARQRQTVEAKATTTGAEL